MMSLPTLTTESIHAAADRLGAQALCTPLFENALLNHKLGRRVLFKAECLQRTGAFKYRGARSAISALSERERQRGVIAYSSGNHAQAVAAVAAEYAIPALIVMPADAPALKIDNTRALGGEVVLYNRRGGEARETIAAALQSERGLTLIPPYDHPEVIAGQGTVGLEIARQCHAAGVHGAVDVLVPCGGGGLTAGVALALADNASDFRVHPVEPEKADDVCRSLESGQRQRLAAVPESICDAIVTLSAGELTWPLLRQHCAAGIRVNERDVLAAMALALQSLKLVVEPGGVVGLAGLLGEAAGIDAETVVVVLSGGNVDPAMIARALASG